MPARSTSRTSSRALPPRPPLSRERIVAAALALVERDGLAALSFRRLGAALRCEAMSLYHYFPSKAHLLDALVDHAIAGVESTDTGETPVERLRRMSLAYREMGHRYPRLFPLVAVHRLNTPTGIALIERVLGAVNAAVPEPSRAARLFRALGYYLVGAVLDETSGYAKGPSAAMPVSDEYIARTAPNLAVAAPYFKADHWEATFMWGLDALLAQIGTEGAAPSARRRPR